MSDDRKEGSSAPSGEPEANRDGGGGTAPKLPPFVQNDDSAAIVANVMAHRRRAYAAALAYSGSGPLTPIVLEQPDHPRSFLWPGVQGEAALPGGGALTADATVVPDWTAVRADMIARLDAIEAGFQKIRPLLEAVDAAYRERGQIGHNNPPEPIDILLLDAAELEMGIAAANLARAELNSEHPRSDVMRLCGLVLNHVATGLWACVQWIAAKADDSIDAFVKAASAEAGKRVVQGLVLAEILKDMTQLHVDLTGFVTEIGHVFERLHLPF
jgi:hypothetical protein